MKLCKLFSIILAVVYLFPSIDFSATINVPDDSATIQSGIDGAANGDTVLVAPGVYNENISFNGKGIVLLSFGGRDVTCILSATPDSAVVLLNNSEGSSSILDDFTINGNSNSPGILCDGASPIIQNCDIVNCSGNGNLVGILCKNSAAKVRYNLVHNNYGTGDGAGIVALGSQSMEISYNEVYDNTGHNAPGIAVVNSSVSANISIHHNLVRNNSGNAVWAGGIHIAGTNCEIINNTVVGNTQGITIINGAGTTILNNIIVSNQDEGIIPGSASVNYNDIWNNGSANSLGSNGISTDPLFLDESQGDFALQALSPCVDAGDPNLLYNDPDGTRNDMGVLPTIQPGNLPAAININLGSEFILRVVNQSPTFYWSFYDTVGSQIAYEIEAGTDEDWAVAEMWASGEVYSGDTSALYAGSPLEDGITYYYRIRVNDGSVWGDWHNRLFSMNSTPSSPVPLFPSSQDTVNYHGVSLVVENSSDLEGDLLTYDFEIYDDPGLITIADSQHDAEEGNDTTWSKLFQWLSTDNTYWWRARSYDGYEYSDWSLEQSFVTKSNITISVPGIYQTIQAGINASFSGDTILVSPGTYTENINFMGKRLLLSSTNGRGVTTIKSASSGTAVITDISDMNPTVLDGFTIDGTSNSPGIYLWGAIPTIQNCDIINCHKGIFCDKSAARIRHNSVHDNYESGIFVLRSQFVEISYNEVYNNSAEANPGIAVGNYDVWGSSDISIHHNLVRNNIGTSEWAGGIHVKANNCEIRNNTIVNNTQGITVINGETTTILNNIVVSNQNEGIIPDLATADYNDFWNNGSANDPGENGISLDPLFTDELNNDYTLAESSPCINAGDPDPLYNDPDGSRNDIGAYWNGSGLICGDVNIDYNVNIFDITFLISYLYRGGSTPDPMYIADVNHDSSVNIFDVTYLISYLYRGGTEPDCL
jgi:parallel beta-helix repeat protein